MNPLRKIAAGAVLVFLPFQLTAAEDDPTQRDFMAVMSPDQTRLAYYSYRNESSPEIFLLELSTGLEVNLTGTDDVWDIEPDWSPDGSTLAFARGTSMRDLQISLLDVASGNVETLTDDEGSNSRPAWSRDGRYIFYHQRFDDQRAFIRRIDLQSGENKRVTDESLISTSPYVSRRDGIVAFIGTDPASRQADVYVMRADGSDRRRITFTDVDERSARFAPDGQHLVVALQPDGLTTGLYLTNLEGAEYRELSVYDRAHTYSASFSPDGKSIYYDIGDWDGDFLIYRSDFDNGRLNPERITGIGRAALLNR